MKKWFKWIGIALAALVVFSLVRDLALKAVVTVVASRSIGAPVRMDGFSLGLTRQSVRITGLRVYNPPGFPREPFVEIPLVSVKMDSAALLQGKLHLKQVEFTLKELVLVKNKEGKSNLDSLKIAGQEEKGGKKPAKEMALQIDLLKLQMGRVVQKDFRVEPPSVEVHEIGISKSYKNITSPQQLAALVLMEPMKSAGIKGAAIYGAAALTGVGLVPVVAGSILLGKDNVEKEFGGGYPRVYDACLAVLQQGGSVKSEDRGGGMITGEVPGGSVTIRLEKDSGGKVKVTVSARKMMLPKPDVAGGVLYQISERLK